MSKLSDRLAEAKRELGISTRGMVEAAAKGGFRLSNHSASVYTSGKHPETPDPNTLEALSHVLRVPLAEVRELAGLPADTEPFEAHPSSALLTPPQRTAVNEIIRLLAESNKGAAHDRQGDTQPRTQTGSTVDGSEDRREDGGTPGRRQTPMSEDNNVHHLDQGKLQPPPARRKSAAYEPDAELEGITEARKSRERGEESQDED